MRRRALAAVLLTALLAWPSPPAAQAAPQTVGGCEQARVVARRLDDGRIEFGVQMQRSDGSWSERLQPERRYMPADAREGRWLRSTPFDPGCAPPPPPAAERVELPEQPTIDGIGGWIFYDDNDEVAWGSFERALLPSRGTSDYELSIESYDATLVVGCDTIIGGSAEPSAMISWSHGRVMGRELGDGRQFEMIWKWSLDDAEVYGASQLHKVGGSVSGSARGSSLWSVIEQAAAGRLAVDRPGQSYSNDSFDLDGLQNVLDRLGCWRAS